MTIMSPKKLIHSLGFIFVGIFITVMYFQIVVHRPASFTRRDTGLTPVDYPQSETYRPVVHDDHNMDISIPNDVLRNGRLGVSSTPHITENDSRSPGNEPNNVLVQSAKITSREAYRNTIRDDVLHKYNWINITRFTPNMFLRRSGKYNNSRDNVLLFLHNQKSGGTTLKKCIDRITAHLHLPDAVGIMDRDVSDLSETFSGTSDFHNRSKLYVSHNAFGLCDELDDPLCSYFTLLRDPIDRMISSFEYCKEHVFDSICIASDVHQMNLTQWASHQGSYFFRQLMYKPSTFCSEATFNSTILPILQSKGYYRNGHKRVPCWYRHKLLLDNVMSKNEKDIVLDFILEKLEEWFALIVITEEYDMSLKLLQRAFNLPFYELCGGFRTQITKYATEEGRVQGSSKDDLIKQLKLQLQQDSTAYDALYYDIRIYEKALEIFHLEKRAFFEEL